MNQNLIIFLALAVLVPILFTPLLTYGNISSDQGEINVLVTFHTQKNLNAIKNDITNDLFGKFNAIGNDFKNKGQYTTFQNLNFTANDDPSEMIWEIGELIINGTTFKGYQITPEIQYAGITIANQTEFETELNAQVSQLRIDLLQYIEDNNGISVRSYLKFTFGEVEIDELF